MQECAGERCQQEAEDAREQDLGAVDAAVQEVVDGGACGAAGTKQVTAGSSLPWLSAPLTLLPWPQLRVADATTQTHSARPAMRARGAPAGTPTPGYSMCGASDHAIITCAPLATVMDGGGGVDLLDEHLSETFAGTLTSSTPYTLIWGTHRRRR